MCKQAVKKLPLVIKHVPDRYKTKQTHDKTILENSETLEFVPAARKINRCVIKLLIITIMH